MLKYCQPTQRLQAEACHDYTCQSREGQDDKLDQLLVDTDDLHLNSFYTPSSPDCQSVLRRGRVVLSAIIKRLSIEEWSSRHVHAFLGVWTHTCFAYESLRPRLESILE